MLLVSPVSWTHYYSAWLLAVLCVPLWLAHHGRPVLAKAFGALPALLAWIHYPLMEIVGPLGLLGLGTTAWFIAVCGTILWVEAGAAVRGFDVLSSNDVGRTEVYHPHIRISPALAHAEASRE
jgi:hypothetical protein